LAGIADALAKGRPALAAPAADRAYALLNKNVALAETGFAVQLGEAFARLGDAGRSSEVTGIALGAADVHAREAEAQYDLASGNGIAEAVAHIDLAALGLSLPYQLAAAYDPADALRHARACKCRLARPLILANLARAIAGAPLQAVRF
jgi:hypothetical protein